MSRPPLIAATEFGRALEKNRLKRKLSREKFAELIGVSKWTYNDWCRGRRKPNPCTIAGLKARRYLSADFAD